LSLDVVWITEGIGVNFVAENLESDDPGYRSEMPKKLAEYTTKMWHITCECKPVQRLWDGQRNQANTTFPFNYLTISMLSCSTCRVWLKAFNELGEQQFYTKGSHEAWYLP